MAERFFTGKPCRNGHTDERYVSTGLCITCTRERMKRIGWTEKNPERRKAICKKYRDANREKVMAASARSIAKKPHVSKAWVQANAPKIRVYKQRNRSRRAAAAGTLSKDIVPRLMSSQKSRCANCRVDIRSSYQIDHIMPLARGGLNADDNVQLLCGPCNRRKSAKDPVAWAQSEGRLL